MNADKLSAVQNMKTVTVRELDRRPSAVLDVCDRDGAVRVRRRDGRTYTLRPDAGPDRITEIPNIRDRLRKIFPKQLTRRQVRQADSLLASE
jgi:hypothetical protein